MKTFESDGHPLLRLEAHALGTGLVAGLLGGIVMGVVLQAGTDLLQVLAAFAGGRSLVRGWIVHLLFSLGYGALFAAVVSYPPVRDFLSEFGPLHWVLVGITYATMIAAVSIAVLPFVYELPWAPAMEKIPVENVPGVGFGGLVPSVVFALAHVVYGAVLGAAYVVLANLDSKR